MTLELRAVSKLYDGRPALEEIELTLEAGQSVGVLGRSGSGKSTLLRLLAGLETPTDGLVLVDGVVASEPARILIPPPRRGIAMVFQDLALWPNLTVLGNVTLGLSSSLRARRDRKVRGEEALSICGIEHLRRRKPWQLSGGEQQRVALARAIASRPRFLFLDEPFTSLDTVTKAQIIEEVSRIVRTHGMGLVLVTHEPLDAVTLCGRAIVLEQGSILESGRWSELLPSPRSRLLEAFKERLGTLPRCGKEERSPD